MRVWVRVELFEKYIKPGKHYFPVDCTLGKWVDFDVLPRVGEEIVFDDRNDDAHRSTVQDVRHWLPRDPDESVTITLTCREDGLGDMGHADSPGWHYHRDYLIEDGFVVSDSYWEADE